MSSFIKEHRTGIVGTIIFHVIVGAIFIFFGYATPLPLPEEEGILINFGDNDDGLGFTEPKVSELVQEQKALEKQKETTTKSSTDIKEDGNLTQDFEEAPAVKEKVKEKKTEEKKVEVKPEPKKEEKTEVKVEQKVNEQALFHGRNRDNTGTSNEGETQGQGNQGSKTGSVDSNDHSGGDSMGANGTSFNLSGRNPESLPKPDYIQQIEGKVVVEITVDKYGNVTDAIPGAKGSTTLDANLLAAAKKAALKAKFDKKPDAAAFQKGTITYFFRLQ